MRILAALAASLPLLSFASSTTADYTDLWYNPNESGWGANVVQQGSTMFVTLFIYGSDNQPTWYVASAVTQQGDSASSLFSGPLYKTTGPYWLGSFNPSSVGVTQVGSLSFSASNSSSAAIAYTVNGSGVSRSVVRQTFGGDNYTGAFLGGSMGTWSSCGARGGYVESGATFTLAQNGSSVQIREDGSNYTCTYNGTAGANGRFGTFGGSGICSFDGVNFTFTASDAEISRDAFSTRISIQQVGGCHFDGRMGGIRKGAL